MKKEYDIAIVGSGAGGSTVAARLAPLAEAGARIALLEAGPHFPVDYFTQREIEMLNIFAYRGAFPTTDGAMTLSFGKALGGSTLMYTGVTFRLPEEVCADWNVEGLSSKNLQPRFERLEKEINAIVPEEGMMNENNRLFRKACQRLGLGVQKIRLNLRNCEGMGFCNLGCAKGNKQGTLAVQIPEARKAGIEIIPNCTVERIDNQVLTANVCPAPKGTLPGPWSAGRVKIKARQIILAGGTIGTSAILLRSGFQKQFPVLGRYVTLHPALVVYGIHPHKVNGFKGFPKVFYCDDFSKTLDYYLETAFYYPFITAKNTGLWGDALNYVMDRYDRLMCILILSHDEASSDNRVLLDKKGSPKLNYKISASTIETLCRAQIQASRIFFEAGCEEAIMPCAEKILFKKGDVRGSLWRFISAQNFLPNKVPVASAHLQGGCRMGGDSSDSVTNSWGQVHGHPGLFVADGSLFPKSSHVNPYLTIMALADRVSEKVLEGHGA